MEKIKTLQSFKLYYGSYFGDKFEVELNGKKVKYAGSEYSIYDYKEKNVNDNTIHSFIDQLNTIPILKIEDYFNDEMRVLDGLEVTIDITYNGTKKANFYPNTYSPIIEELGDAVMNKMLNSVSELIDEPKFFTDQYLSDSK